MLSVLRCDNYTLFPVKSIRSACKTSRNVKAADKRVHDCNPLHRLQLKTRFKLLIRSFVVEATGKQKGQGFPVDMHETNEYKHIVKIYRSCMGVDQETRLFNTFDPKLQLYRDEVFT